MFTTCGKWCSRSESKHPEADHVDVLPAQKPAAVRVTSFAEETFDPRTNLLLPRRFVPRESSQGGFSIRIATWDLLADGLTGLYGGQKSFAHLPSKYLRSEYRIPRILAEISRMNPDILGLQEFDFYDNVSFLSEMEALGYGEAGKQEKRWSPCVNFGRNPDSVAIFYKRDLFEDDPIVSYTEQGHHKRWFLQRIDSHRLHADDDGLFSLTSLMSLMYTPDRARLYEVIQQAVRSGDIDDPGFIDRARSDPSQPISFEKFREWCCSSRPAVSVAARFVPMERPDLALCVIVTHLVSRKKMSGEQQRVYEIKEVLKHPNHQETKRGAHVFICCDLNSSPQNTRGYPPLTYPYLVGSERADPQFKSAMRKSGSEVEWTSWKKRPNEEGEVDEFKETVDYVFYPLSGWRVTSVYGVPNQRHTDVSVRYMVEENALGGNPGPIPGNNYPSDHLAICAQLELEE